MKNDFEIKQKYLLSAMCHKDDTVAISIYETLWEQLHPLKWLSEVDQKIVNQIQQIYKKFKGNINVDRKNRMDEIYHQIQKKMAYIVKTQVKNPSHVTYDEWAGNLGLNEKQISVMLGTVSSLQITIGCSNCCRRCNEWALPFVRKHFTFDTVIRFIDHMFQMGNTAFSLYNASDPLEWRHKEKTIVHIMRFMAERKYTPGFGLLTKIPKGTDKIAETLLREGVDIGVSITQKNRLKAAAIEENTGRKFDVHHDVEELEIPAGLDDDFSVVKSSITDTYGTEITPEGAFIIIPAFTSALNPTGQCRIQVNTETEFFLEKKVGHESWAVAYFKPLSAIDLSGQKMTLKILLTPQIQNMLQDSGEEGATPPGMMSIEAYFKTFEPDAVKRRKTLLPSVVKEYCLKIPVKGTGNVSQQRKQVRNKIRQYIAFCRMESVNNLKKFAFSFFLSAIADYLRHHSAERDIIRFLRKTDAAHYLQKYDITFKKSSLQVDKIVETCEENVFSLFQAMMFRLLEDPDDEIINEFISKYPACYDAEADMFMSTNELN